MYDIEIPEPDQHLHPEDPRYEETVLAYPVDEWDCAVCGTAIGLNLHESYAGEYPAYTSWDECYARGEDQRVCAECAYLPDVEANAAHAAAIDAILTEESAEWDDSPLAHAVLTVVAGRVADYFAEQGVVFDAGRAADVFAGRALDFLGEVVELESDGQTSLFPIGGGFVVRLDGHCNAADGSNVSVTVFNRGTEIATASLGGIAQEIVDTADDLSRWVRGVLLKAQADDDLTTLRKFAAKYGEDAS